MVRILVVDDEEGIRTFIAQVLEGMGHQVTMAADGQVASEILASKSFHLMITDLNMPRLDGMALLRKSRAEQPEMEVVVLTAHGTVDSAVEAMKLGAIDYMQKPLSGPDELRLTVSRALERRRLLEAGLRHKTQDHSIEPVARDPAMLMVMKQVEMVAPTDSSVLLTGESGTGKEVIARSLHALSPRRERPFVAVNCAGLSRDLLESEMFGHERGAFTGAVSRQRGRFELADTGTLFLDEVSEVKPDLQARLLRVLEERSFERVGGTRTIEVDVRLVAATNRDLQQAMQAGHFREDLFHRLAVFPIHLPALRERPQDILLLAEHLLERVAAKLGRSGLSLSAEASKELGRHSWPGNVRELGNVLERAAILSAGSAIEGQHLLLGPEVKTSSKLEGTLKDLEREAIRQALLSTGGHRKNTAKRLGIALRTLYGKLKEYDLD